MAGVLELVVCSGCWHGLGEEREKVQGLLFVPTYIHGPNPGVSWRFFTGGSRLQSLAIPLSTTASMLV